MRCITCCELSFPTNLAPAVPFLARGPQRAQKEAKRSHRSPQLLIRAPADRRRTKTGSPYVPEGWLCPHKGDGSQPSLWEERPRSRMQQEKETRGTLACYGFPPWKYSAPGSSQHRSCSTGVTPAARSSWVWSRFNHPIPDSYDGSDELCESGLVSNQHNSSNSMINLRGKSSFRHR